MAVAYQTIKGSSGLYVPVGMIMQWTKASTPTGFIVCDGSAVSRTTYAALFDAIGTTHGVGDGSTTFNLPDLQGKLPVGDDGGVSYTVAGTGGSTSVTPTLTKSGSVSKSGTASGSLSGVPDSGNLAVSVSGNVNIANHTLSVNEIPSHTHNQTLGPRSGDWYNGYYRNRASVSNTDNDTVTGNQNHNTGNGGGHTHTGGHNLSGNMTGAPGVGNLAVSITDNIAVSDSIAVNSSAIDTQSPYIVLRYVIKF